MDLLSLSMWSLGWPDLTVIPVGSSMKTSTSRSACGKASTKSMHFVGRLWIAATVSNVRTVIYMTTELKDHVKRMVRPMVPLFMDFNFLHHCSNKSLWSDCFSMA
eukprot:1932726-Ditylum_brightwellii.AAC.1